MIREKWYLNDVKEKENQTWSDGDKVKVFQLCQKYAVEKVARIFSTSIIKVYNINRITKKGLANQCYHCGDPLTAEEVVNKKSLIGTCSKCKDASLIYKRSRRKAALSQGLCGYCEKLPVIPGHTGCRQCLSATHRRRNKGGFCGQCGDNKVKHENGALCEECITKSIKYSEQHRKRQHANHQ